MAYYSTLKSAFRLLICFFLTLIVACNSTNKKNPNSITKTVTSFENKKIIDTSKIQNKTFEINGQTWTKENLNINCFRNGDIIFEAKSQEDWIRASKLHIPAWCYYDNNSDNGKTHGRLYNWYAVMDERGLAPLGFHIPNNREYEMLLLNLGLSNHGNLENKHNVATKLKSTSNLWTTIMDKYNETSTNSSGFSALPSGLRYSEGGFNNINEEGHWWTSTNIWHSSYNQTNLQKIKPSQLSIDDWVSGVGAGSFDAGTGLSVRCIKGEINTTTKIPIIENEFLELDKDGKPREGTYTFGDLVTKTFINGIENGVRIYDDGWGVIILKQTYKDGVLNGESSEYNKHGFLIEVGNYNNGKKVGIWTKYKCCHDYGNEKLEIESTENFDGN